MYQNRAPKSVLDPYTLVVAVAHHGFVDGRVAFVNPQKLCIVGGGPKGIAVAAKAEVLRRLGEDAPEVHIIEAELLAHHWRRAGGWTDGLQRLGTSPMKDVGFPYSTQLKSVGHAINDAMFELSWSGYLAKNGNLANWTDRGAPPPLHREWAAYLEWVAGEAGVSWIHGEVLSIDRADGDRLNVVVAGAERILCDAIMFTGFGHSDRKLSSRCTSVREFWMDRSKDASLDGKRVFVIGSGETSASITRFIVERCQPMDLNVVSPTETVYSRGESFLENSLYSDPTTWSGLSENQRREFIRRTDRAVFSQDAQNLLSARGIHRHIQGRVLSVQATADALNLEIAHPGTNVIHTAEADVVIDARGGNSLWFLELLTPALLEDVAASCGGELTAEALEQRIGHDLSLIGCPAKIFIPNLAALRQGPGFPNLSSLGILSDRVLAGLASRQPTSQAAAAVNAS